MRVAIQGAMGSFSEAAARRRWPELEAVPCRDVQDVVAAVREGIADAGILPIENSLIGSVTTTYDLLHEAFGDGRLALTHEIHARSDRTGALPSGGARAVSDLARQAPRHRGAGERLGYRRERRDGGP